jgi:hypothetical protein
VLTLVTPPAVEPVSLAQAKLHLRVDFADADALIAALIAAVRLKCESHLDRSFVTTSWLQTYDGFPGQFSRFSPAAGNAGNGYSGLGMGSLYGYVPERFLAGTGEPIVVAKARLIAVQSITYLDPATQARTTLDPSLYSVEAGDGGRISPAYNRVWPSALVYPGSVAIALTMGYGPSAADVPASITAAMLLALGHYYDNCSAVEVGVGVTVAELPMGAKWLLAAEDWGCRA